MRAVVNFLTCCPDPNSPRHQYAMDCLSRLIGRLTYKRGELAWHIADDSPFANHADQLVRICHSAGIEPTVSYSMLNGYGANFNLSTQTTHNYDVVIPLEDDWDLLREFDISDLVDVLAAHEGIECIRLGYLGWTGELTGKLVQIANQTFMLFNPDCSELHVFAGGPRIETVQFERNLGPWPERIRAGWTEVEICNRPTSRVGVAWPLDAGVNASLDYATLFTHVGAVKAD